MNQGEEVYNAWPIARRYVFHGSFVIDFVSSLPLDIANVDQVSFLRTFSMLKLIRIFRLNRIIRNLNMQQTTKASLKTLVLIFNLIVYIHVLACLWYMAIAIQKVWIPNMDFIFFKTDFYT